ncbi:hypothetical protein M758_2G207400 [Ceratodon purpureus]|nr:hypothetical protein M758_2G207400 [Ceratodon purpureus]
MQGGGGGAAPTAEAIIEWLQQEMGYRASPSAEALRRICRGNMMLVWKFLLDRVKSDQTVEKIRRNIHVHGSPVVAKRELKGEAVEEKEKEKEKEEVVKIERSNSGKSVRRRGDYKSRSRPGTGDRPKSRDGVEKVVDNEDSIEKALRERDAAEHEVEKLRLSVQRMGKDLKSRMVDVSKEECERQRVSEEKNNSRHKQVLLESYDQRAEQSTRIFMEYWKRLHVYVEHARDAQRGKTAPSDFGPERTQSSADANFATSASASDEKQVLRETSQERNIRQACEVLSAGLLDKIRSSFPAYDGGSSQFDGQLEVAKLSFEVEGDGIPEEVKEIAISLLKNPPLLLQTMADYSKRVVATIDSETEKIDVRADAERLRYRYENNRVLEDISAEVDDLLNVHRRNPRGSSKEAKNTFKQLRERQRAHAHQFMATEDAINQAAEAKRRSDELILRIHDVGGDAASAQSTGPLRQHELEVWAKERELAGVRASVNTLTSEVQRLHKLCEERRKAEEALRQKWKRIEEFDSRRMGLESIYTALLRANMAAAAAWEHHSRASREQSASTIIPICESLQNKSNAARDLIERELSAFQRSPDNRLYMMPAFSQGLLEGMMSNSASGAEAIAAAERNADLLTARAASGDPSAIPSICRISAATHYPAGGEGGDLGLAQIVDSLRFFLRPGGTSANLIEDLARAVNQVQTLKDLLKSGRGLLTAASASIPEYERSVAQCAEKSAEEDKLALEVWLPELKSAVQEAQRCLEDCKRVRGLVDEWWEQPAATVVDWVTVDGQNVGAWLALVKQLQTAFYEKQLL